MNRLLCRIAAVLFVVCAALLVVGVSAEGDSHNEASKAAEQHEANEAASNNEPAAAHDEGEADEHDDAAETAEHAATEHDSDDAGAGERIDQDESGEEQVLGIDTESPASVIAAVAVSLAVAVGLWLRGRRWLALISVGFAIVFAVFDVAEVRHQLNESRTSLAVLAAVIAAGHLAAATTAGLSARPTGTP